MPPTPHVRLPNVVRRLAAVLLAAAAGCGDHELAGGITDSAFVATMAELERVDRTPGLDSAARANARARTLQGRGLTRAQLEAAAGSLADDPKRALALYREIDRRASGDTSRRVDSGFAVPGARRRR